MSWPEFIFSLYTEEFYKYVKNNHFDYLCECYSESRAGKYYADYTNEKILTKTELRKIMKENGIYHSWESIGSKVIVNNVQYILLN